MEDPIEKALWFTEGHFESEFSVDGNRFNPQTGDGDVELWLPMES